MALRRLSVYGINLRKIFSFTMPDKSLWGFCFFSLFSHRALHRNDLKRAECLGMKRTQSQAHDCADSRLVWHQFNIQLCFIFFPHSFPLSYPFLSVLSQGSLWISICSSLVARGGLLSSAEIYPKLVFIKWGQPKSRFIHNCALPLYTLRLINIFYSTPWSETCANLYFLFSSTRWLRWIIKAATRSATHTFFFNFWDQ